MKIVVFISLIALLLTYLDSKGKISHGLEFAFIILTVVGAIHYNYGSDYNVYVRLFDLFSNDISSFKDIEFRDPGWVILCRLCKPIGFFGMLIIVNIIMNGAYYFFIKRYIPNNYWWIAVAIYVFSTSLYLMNFSMLRQGLAIAIFVLAVPFIIEKKIIPSILFVGIALSIHTSAIVLVPFVLWGYLPQKSSGFLAVALSLMFCLFLFAGSLVERLLDVFVFSSDEFEAYQEYSKNGVSFGLGFLVDMITFIIFIICIQSRLCTHKEYLLIGLACIGCVMIPFQQVYLMAGRLGWYFNAIAMFAIPACYEDLKALNGKVIANGFLALYLLLLVIRYYMFFNVGAFVSSYNKPFETIFSVPWM